jgi:hypothetical protein
MKFILTESQYKRIVESQKVVDRILEKITQGGYESLSIDEKRYLKYYSEHTSKGGDPEKFVDPSEVYDEREGEVFKGMLADQPIQFTFSEESTDGEDVDYYGEIQFGGKEYLGVFTTDSRGYLKGVDFYNVDDEEDYRLQDVIEGLEHELEMFFYEDVISHLR